MVYMKKIIVLLIGIILLTPLAYNGEVNKNSASLDKIVSDNSSKELKNNGYNFKILNDQQFDAYVYTKCDGIEKRIPIVQALLSPIDVDNNISTGENGKDIKINAFILPYIQQVNGNWVLAISVALKVIRLDAGIKDSDFETYVELSVEMNGMQTFRVGLGSNYGEEIPKEARVVFTVVPYLLYEKEPEYYLNLEPVFEGGNSNISIFGEYIGKSHQYIQIDFNPGITSMIKISPNIKIGNTNLTIQRFAEEPTNLKMIYKGKLDFNLTIEKVPSFMSFSIDFSENHFEYKSNDEFNATMLIETRNINVCSKIVYLPRHVIIDGGLNGYLSIFTGNRNTKLILCNSFEKPSIYFMIGNITKNVLIQWEAGAAGYIKIDGAKNAMMEMKVNIGRASLNLSGRQEAQHFSFEWNLSTEGFISIDTNWEWLNCFSMNFSIGDFGFLIGASFLRAEDYRVEWNETFPIFSKYGEIDFMGNFTFSVMLNNIWYNILG